MNKPGATVATAMDRFTDNIWRIIFRLCVDSLSGPATFNPLEAPILLTHVCRYWRLLALDYPYLWRSLQLRYRSELVVDGVGLQNLSSWVQRAKGTGISLRVENYDTYTGNTRILKALRRLSTTLTSLVLINVGLQEFRFLPADIFPALETLVLPGNSLRNQIVRTFHHAPALRRVAIDPVPHYDTFLPLPWGQLTHVIEFFTSEEETWRLIEQMTHIRYLAMIYPYKVKCSADRSWVWPFLPLIVDSLECLSVNLNPCYKHWDVRGPRLPESEIECLYFLDHFHFPNLRSLRFMIWSEVDLNNPDASATDTIWRFLGRLRRYQKLEYFSLSCDSILGIDKLFEAIPTIKTLDIHLRRQPEKDSTALFEALTIKDDSEQHLLPQLKEVVIDLTTSCRWGSLRCEELIALRGFLISRLEKLLPGANFKLVLYGTDATLIESYISGIDDLVEAGMCCEVYHFPSEMEGDVDRLSRWWMHRDPELKDWPEVLDLRGHQITHVGVY